MIQHCSESKTYLAQVAISGNITDEKVGFWLANCDAGYSPTTEVLAKPEYHNWQALDIIHVIEIAIKKKKNHIELTKI